MIDKNKQYKTRDGREVRIYATDGGSEFCVHGAILFPNGVWHQRSWPITGVIGSVLGSDADLIEVRPRIKREVWVNVYGVESGIPDGFYFSKAAADASSCRRRIACVRLTIDCEEGEGL